MEVNYPPRRIISLVPSQTELLYDLGLEEEVVGITKFCVHPDRWYREKRRVGGTKTVHLERIDELQPDLILANKEENNREQVAELAARYPVWVSDIKSVAEALQMIGAIGTLVGKKERADQLAATIREGFDAMTKAAVPKKVAYFIWRKPWMVAGGDTFISDVIKSIGWENVFCDSLRYPEITLDLLRDKNIELVLLSSEPYPFKEAHIAELRTVVPDARILLVDGEMFSWYGSRMQQAVGYLGELLRKETSR